MAHALTPQDEPPGATGALVAHGGRFKQLDPRMRIVMACMFAAVVLALTKLVLLLAALVAAVALLVVSRQPVRPTLSRMAMMDGFVLFMLILLPFSVPGDPMVSVLGLVASWQGFWQAVEIALTANAVILMLMVLVGSMEPVTLGHALHRLRCPDRLVHLLMFTIRYIDVLREEHLRLRAAMKVRGFRPGTNWHTYRSYGYLVGMMLVRAIERSERVLGAMKCRGFSGRMLLLQDHRLSRRDYVFAGLLTGLCLGLLGLDHA